MKINGCSGRQHTEQGRQIIKPGRRPVLRPPHAHVAQRAQRIHQGCRLLDPEEPHHLVFGESPIAEPPQGKYCDHPHIKCKLQLLILHLLKQHFFGQDFGMDLPSTAGSHPQPDVARQGPCRQGDHEIQTTQRLQSRVMNIARLASDAARRGRVKNINAVQVNRSQTHNQVFSLLRVLWDINFELDPNRRIPKAFAQNPFKWLEARILYLRPGLLSTWVFQPASLGDPVLCRCVQGQQGQQARNQDSTNAISPHQRLA